VNSLNTQIVEAVPGREHVFLLADSVETGDDQAMAIGTKFLNTITLAGMPPHHLALKVGVHVILLRNLDAASGLCNGTRLIIWRLAQRLIVPAPQKNLHGKSNVLPSNLQLPNPKPKT
jgi:ATP-dependent DNA helicase PIF1